MAKLDTQRSLDRGTVAVATAVSAVALCARTPGALRDAFWQDEVASARILGEPSAYAALRQVARQEATPPLWYMLGFLAHTAGLGPGGFRWLSVLAGAAAAGLVVIFARRLLPLWASAFAGVLAALAWELVMHGRELRAYALFELLAVLFPLALVRALRAEARWTGVALALLVAAGTMTSYFFGLTVVAGLAWIWLEPAARRDARRLTALIAVGLVPLLAWSPALVHQYRAQRFAWIGPFDLRRLVDTPWLLFLHHVPADAALRVSVPLLFMGAIAAGLIVLAGHSAEGRLCALLVVVPFALATLIWAAGAHVFVSRNLVGAAPFAAVGLAGLAALLPRPAALAVAMAAVAAVAFATARAEATPPTRFDGIARALTGEGWTPGDPIVLLGDFFTFRSPLEWYLPGRPALSLAVPAGGRCKRVYVVALGPRNHARVARSRLLRELRVVGAVEVGRLRGTRLPALAGSAALAAPAVGACVRVLPESGIVPALRHLRGTSA